MKRTLFVVSAITAALWLANALQQQSDPSPPIAAAQPAPDPQSGQQKRDREARQAVEEAERRAKGEKIEAALVALGAQGVSRDDVIMHFADDVLDAVDLDDICKDRETVENE